jgi:hypothetical protein
MGPGLLATTNLSRRLTYAIVTASAHAVAPFLVWPRLTKSLFSADSLPHLFCYWKNPGLVWTHVAADALIGIAYFAISATLAYLVYRTRRDIPFHWMFLAFGLFIIACGGTPFMEVVTIRIPVYVVSAVVKVFRALASVTTAVALPVTVPRILTMVRQANKLLPIYEPAKNGRKLCCGKCTIG